MQVNHTKKLVSNLKRATVIRGKWNGAKYHVIHKLGEGACGVVYLCERNGIETALKLGTDSARITTEVNVLKSFQRVQGKRLGPSLLDVDDWVTTGGITLPFYVMEYVKGQELATFLHGKGSEWLGVLLLQLLMDLGNLHESGWVFGDLKTDNLLVTSPPPRLRLIDVGGTTQIGRAIKEYTEFYDRGYWLKGSRKAEPSYDLFAVTMILLEVGGRGRFERGSDPRQTLERKLQQATALKPFTPLINNVWDGEYQNGLEMREDLVKLLQRRSEPKKRDIPASTRTSRRKKTKKTSFATFEIGAIFVSVIIFYLIYMLFFL